MFLANPSRIESMSGERQGWPSGCPWPLDRIDRLQPVRQFFKRREGPGWKAAPASHLLQTSQGFFRRVFEGYSVDIVLIIVGHCRSSRSLPYGA